MIAIGAYGTVHAQEAPPTGFTFGPGETIEHDSNVLRLSGTQPGLPVVGDTSYTTDLMASFNQTYGREQVSASATIGRVLYEHLSLYDFTQQDIRAALTSSMPYSVEASIDFVRTSALAHFADFESTIRDVIDFNALNAKVDFPLEANWRGVLDGSVSQLTNSAVSEQSSDVNTAEIDGGIRFQPVTGNHVDLLLRSVEGTYPNNSPASLIPPGYHDVGADLRANWTFSGASHLQGRAGFVRRSNDQMFYFNTITGETELLDRNFSGPAYDLTYTWQVSAASRLTLFGLRMVGPSGDNNFLTATTHTFKFTPSYQASAKIEVDAYYQWTATNYFTDVYDAVYSQPPGTTLNNYAHSAGLGVIWKPRRWIKVGLDIHRDVRDSDSPTWTYTNNVAILSLQSSF
jgi:hypothetical protein